jgi:hypothetical protein
MNYKVLLSLTAIMIKIYIRYNTYDQRPRQYFFIGTIVFPLAPLVRSNTLERFFFLVPVSGSTLKSSVPGAVIVPPPAAGGRSVGGVTWLGKTV